MKLWNQVLLGLVLVAGSAVGAERAPQWEIVNQESWILPHGISVSAPFYFNPAVAAQAIKIEYSGSYCQAVRAASIDVTYAGTDGFTDRIYPVQGIFELKRASIHSLIVRTSQPQYSKITCRETIYASKAGDVASEEFEFLGKVSFSGGVQTGEVTVPFSEKVTHFWIERPKYCEELKIKSAETKTNEHYYPATLLDKAQLIYEVGGTDGERISAIRLKMSGPPTLTCDLSLYTKRLID